MQRGSYARKSREGGANGRATWLAGAVVALFLSLWCGPAAAGGGAERLERNIRRIIDGRRATVGVAVGVDDELLLAVNDSVRFPLMSVFKVHVAVAALARMEREGIMPEEQTTVGRGWLREGTYSPLRDSLPGTFAVRISYRDLIRCTVSLSDNNTCDWLVEFAGGTERVDGFVRGLGIGDFEVVRTEHAMHERLESCYDNWSSPSSMVRLLRSVYSGEVLHGVWLEEFRRSMAATSTGADKLRAGVPAGVELGHKTGHSDRLADGVMIGDNDSGVFSLPDGRRCFVCVFIRDSAESDATNAAMTAEIAAAVYEFVASPRGGDSQ